MLVMARNLCLRLFSLSSATSGNGTIVPVILRCQYHFTAKRPLAFTEVCSGPLKGHLKITAPNNPRPAVGVAVFITSKYHPGCILVGIRKGSTGEGLYALPGGHLEFGESWEECGRREVLEETGLRLEDVQYCTVVNAIQEKENLHYVTLFFKGEVDNTVKSEPENLEPGKCLGWEWIKWCDFPPLDKLFCPLQVVRQQGYNPFNRGERHDVMTGAVHQKSQSSGISSSTLGVDNFV